MVKCADKLSIDYKIKVITHLGAKKDDTKIFVNNHRFIGWEEGGKVKIFAWFNKRIRNDFTYDRKICTVKR